MKPQGKSTGNNVIMVVDDSRENLELLSEILKSKGYTVKSASSGELALKAAKSSPPDLILLDINMPEMNGYEVCKKIKANNDLKDIPVIFISGLPEMKEKLEAFSLGGVDYITKPFLMEDIYTRVAKQLKVNRPKKNR